MDTRDRYRDLIQHILTEHARIPFSYGELCSDPVFDREHDRYLLVLTGWQSTRRVHGVLVDVELKDEKVWIHYDGIEEGVTKQLLAAGVPREHIVLAFKHPSMRKLTGFAAA
jgi:hypothetical protein